MSFFKIRSDSFITKSFGIIFAVFCCVLILFPMHSHAGSQITITQPIYHAHTGSSESGGGCYTKKKTETTTVEKKCKGTMVYWPALDRTSCNICGAAYDGDQSDRECWSTYKEEVTTTTYKLGCGMTKSTEVGSLTVVKSTDEWTQKVILTASYEDKNMNVKDEAFIWNGGTPTAKNTYEITSNGTYSVCLNAGKNADTESGTITLEISNIDNTAPTIALEYDRTKNVAAVKIKVTSKDLQPDGTPGCGLSSKAYSFDGGKTWSNTAAHTVTQNGMVSIAVRDCLDNVNCMEKSITNIDSTGPVITYTLTPDSWTNQSVDLKLDASDRNDEGNEGIGLAQEWYSLDGGISWLSEPVQRIGQNQELVIMARDRYHNQSTLKIQIDHIDKEGPVVALTMKKSGQKVNLTAQAEDTLSGLHGEAYSWDKGVTYSQENTISVTKNGTYQVFVRDLAGNVSQQSIKVKSLEVSKPASEPENELETEPSSSTAATEETMEETTEETTEAAMEETIEETTEEPEKNSMDPGSKEQETTEETTGGTEEMEESIMIMEERIQEAEMVTTQKVEKIDHKMGWLLFTLAVVLVLLLSLILGLFFLWLRTIAVYVYDNTGKIRYLGRRLIHYREGHYIVQIPESTLEQCMTTHFCFCPSWLFVRLHGKEDMQFVFPEQLCVTKRIKEKMEISLL